MQTAYQFLHGAFTVDQGIAPKRQDAELNLILLKPRIEKTASKHFRCDRAHTKEHKYSGEICATDATIFQRRVSAAEDAQLYSSGCEM